jgi:hypothetical protein
MSDTEFFRTAMGRTYYERTLPELVRDFARLNELFEQLIELLSATPTPAPPDDDRKEPQS